MSNIETVSKSEYIIFFNLQSNMKKKLINVSMLFDLLSCAESCLNTAHCTMNNINVNNKLHALTYTYTYTYTCTSHQLTL